MAFNFLSKITGKGMDDHADEDLAASIQAHLIHLLNIRQGRTEHLSDYGLPDIHEIYYNLPDSLDALARRIKQTIHTYEPRLTKLQVKQEARSNPDADEFQVTYRISGIVVEGSKTSTLTFRTEVARDGYTTINPVKQYG